eukprot:CFRG6787T1
MVGIDVTAMLAKDREMQKSIIVEKDQDVDIDLGNLMCYDSAPVDAKILSNKSQGKEEYIRNLTRDNTQLLFNAIWEQPTHAVENVYLATLPKPIFNLPREKVIPEEKAQTKWEKFAETKGITKIKRSRMVMDETTQELAPRYGYKRANDDTKDWLIEVPGNADPYEDQFEKRDQAKKDRVAKNKKNQERNIERAGGAASFKGINGLSVGVGGGVGGGITTALNAANQERRKKVIDGVLTTSKKSTASIGKFDQKLRNEPKIKQEKGPNFKKRKFDSVAGSKDERGNEKELNVRLMEKIANRGSTVMDTTKAANREIGNVRRQDKEARMASRKPARRSKN